MLHQFGRTCRPLYDRSVGSKVSKEDCNAAVVAVGIFNRTQDFRIAVYNAFDIFCDCFSGCSNHVCFNQILLCKFSKNRLYTARVVEFAHKSMSCGSKVTEVWRAV